MHVITTIFVLKQTKKYLVDSKFGSDHIFQLF